MMSGCSSKSKIIVTVRRWQSEDRSSAAWEFFLDSVEERWTAGLARRDERLQSLKASRPASRSQIFPRATLYDCSNPGTNHRRDGLRNRGNGRRNIASWLVARYGNRSPPCHPVLLPPRHTVRAALPHS